MKKLLTYGLLALAVAGAGFAAKQRLGESAPAQPEVAALYALPGDGIVVTYFTTDVRCSACHKIEELTRQTLETRFADELKSGHVVFRSVNIDQAENKHFVDEYELVSKSVVVSFRERGEETRWENLQDVWLKLNDPEDFQNYVASAIQ